MSKKKKELQINYLDLIPERSAQLRWHTDIRGRMVLEIENKGAFNTIAQKLFGKPRYTKIHLDDNGTFIWPLIDGEKTVDRDCSTGKRRIWGEGRAFISKNCEILPDNGELSFCKFYQ